MRKILFILSEKYKLRSINDCLEICKEDKKIISIPYSYIEQIVLFSFVPTSSKVFMMLAKNNISYHILSKYGNYIGSYFPSFLVADNSNITYRILQYEKYFSKSKRLELAKFFVKSKIINFSKYFEFNFMEFLSRLQKTSKLTEILNVEALATKHIYSIFREELNKFNISFSKRDYNPPKDSGNAILSFAFSLFYNLITPILIKENLDIFISYLHIKRGKHRALVSDFMECIRPVIMFKILKFLEETKNIKFVKIKNACYLSPESIKAYLNFINEDDNIDSIFKDLEFSIKEFKELLKNL